MKVYIITMDSRVERTMEMYDYFCKKYWPTVDFTVLGFQEPKFKADIVKFISLGIDEGPHKLNNQLYNFFKSIETDQFIFAVDDMPILEKVDANKIEYVYEILKTNSSVGRIGLTIDNADRPYEKIQDITDNSFLFRNLPMYNGYRLSATWSAWNREYFLLYLNDYENLWQWEVDGSNRSNSDHYEVLGTVPAIITHAHLIQHGEFRHNWYMPCIKNNKYKPNFIMNNDDKNKLKQIYNL